MNTSRLRPVPDHGCRKRLFRFSAMACAALICAAPTWAAAQQAKVLPPEVRAYFDQARQECREAGDRLHVEDETSFAETADFNGDGHPDCIVHMASLVCPSLGFTEYCGSAGCMISILVSVGGRLREVASDNFQDFAVTRPVGGKQSIAFAAHGTFCGHKSGADTCFGIMSWTPQGFKTTYTGVEPAALAAAQAVAPANNDPVKNPKFDWKVIGPASGKKGASIAESDGSAQQPKIVVACAEKIPVLVVAFPPGAKAPPAGVRVMIEIGDALPSQPHADIVMQPVQDKTAYIGQLTRAALTIMQTAGKQSYPFVPAAWTTQDRDYWIDIPTLPLTHFNEASKSVLGSCTAGLR